MAPGVEGRHDAEPGTECGQRPTPREPPSKAKERGMSHSALRAGIHLTATLTPPRHVRAYMSVNDMLCAFGTHQCGGRNSAPRDGCRDHLAHHACAEGDEGFSIGRR